MQHHKTGNASMCSPHQMNLTHCIKSNVPAFKRIQEQCLDSLKAYEGCLFRRQQQMKDNESNSGKGSDKPITCVSELASLRLCSKRAVEGH